MAEKWIAYFVAYKRGGKHGDTLNTVIYRKEPITHMEDIYSIQVKLANRHNDEASTVIINWRRFEESEEKSA